MAPTFVPVELSDDERDILRQIAGTWADADMPLSGGHLYGEVMELFRKLGLSQVADNIKRDLLRKL